MLTNLYVITHKMWLKLNPNISNLIAAKINTAYAMSGFSF